MSKVWSARDYKSRQFYAVYYRLEWIFVLSLVLDLTFGLYLRSRPNSYLRPEIRPKPNTCISHFKKFCKLDFTARRGLCCRPVSVRPSLCHVSGLYPDGWRYRQISFSTWYPHHSNFFDPSAGIQFQREPLQRGRKIQGVGGGIKRCFWLTSDICLSVCLSRPWA